MAHLCLSDVSVHFGGLQALTEVNFDLRPGEIVSLIGPNGAGKTTIFNVITGVYRISGGSVTYDGQTISGLRPHHILARGIARTFQNIRLFTAMTALENVMVARHCRSRAGVFGSVLRTRRQRIEERDVRDRAMAALTFSGLGEFAHAVARNLPYGLQRRLEIARALGSDPKTILLDEPAAGLNPSESRELMAMIQRIAAAGVNVLLVEHDMSVVMNVSHRVVVLDHGVCICQGTPEEVRSNPAVIEAYLGSEVD
jgi:branched-chain amino acid transport system ATP-binding protein